jgi:hypothetical protein
MRPAKACRSCGHASIWAVRGVNEHGSRALPTQLGAPQHLDPFEAHVCAECGHVVWYSDGAEALHLSDPRMRVVEDERVRCECGAAAPLLVAQVDEQAPRQVAPLHLRGLWGSLSLLACRGCGLTQWFAIGSDVLPQRERTAGSCRRCHQESLRWIEPFLEAGGLRLPVVFPDRGHFALEICDGCGNTRWFARGLGKLQADGRRVTLLEAATQDDPRVSVGGGPYR